MDSEGSPDQRVTHLPSTVVLSAKVVVAGGFGVGKTTLVGSVSQVTPLRMEEPITEASIGVDDVRRLPGKNVTTVGMDFGRLQLSDELVLYLFGLPGQTRFRHIYEGVATGALGALVLADTRSLENSYHALEFLEEQGIPYAVAINTFDDAPTYPLEEVREALNLEDHTPLTTCDARLADSSRRALVTLFDYLIARRDTAALVESRP